MDRRACEHSIHYTYELPNFKFTKGKMNEARVVDFSGIGRKEEVERVSKLSKSSALPIFAAPITPNGQLKPPATSVVRHTVRCCGR